jgi:transmembrane sensor
MNSPDNQRNIQALEWARRIADPLFVDWAAHMRWLEDDARNAEAFDLACLDMEAATSQLAPAPSHSGAAAIANDNGAAGPSRHWWRTGAWGGLAAACAAGLLLWPRPVPQVDDRAVITPPGVQRTVALADGSTVALNGSSRLRIGADRSVALIDGEGFFEVRHDATHPFTLKVGSTVIQDVGTAFDVSTSADVTRVAVREGAVAIDPQGQNLQLTAGQGARITADGAVTRAAVAQAADIDGWRRGRLVYQGASWSEVVIDLTRALGVDVSVAPGMAATRFTGVIIVDPDPNLTIRRLAAAADLTLVRQGHGWLLSPR